jgi:hypothetical protein
LTFRPILTTTATTAELVYSDKMGMTGACTVTKWV